MNATIERIVGLLFEDIEETPEVRAIHEEVLTNCQERYNDLTASGMTEDEAIEAVVESLKGMEEMLSSYPRRQTVYEEGTGEADYVFAPEGISTLDVTLVSADVIVEPSADGMIHVHSDGKVMARADGGTLRISAADDNRLRVGVNIRLFSFRFSYSSEEVRIQLPASMEIHIRTTSGNVEWRGVTAQSLNLTTASGDVELTDARIARLLQVQSASGDAELRNCSAQQLRVTTASGDVTCAHLEAADSASITCSSGDVNWRGDCAGLTIGTTSGDVELHGAWQRLSVKTTSGDVRAVAVGNELREMIGCTVSGDMTVCLSMPAELHCHTRHGDLRQRIPSTPGGAQLHLTSTSGDITVE